MNAVQFNQLRAPAAIRPAESSRTPDLEDYAFWAFDPRSPLSFLERVGLMLWLGGYGRDGFL